jgi:hypothetical protein
LFNIIERIEKRRQRKERAERSGGEEKEMVL